ncbi:lytic transglycosylase domain-containing protein [Roseomonas sp. SSH11]|uniref:Lytic transglycosylase domain-containing protein n=1 Tax=Pararoseomonas baculiformis TaxID=2820812 RepID=A0ABS4AE41_9PROT|nr:lytic transglycosylase domain-containing protein [Pararoseomonas baculiformis]MBP0445246.1 lytic transglycosylase domain-containing protein [Pararoseomonas baculiformis]
MPQRNLLPLLLMLLAFPALAQTSPTALCRAAIVTAEREYALPAGLLAAIGRVESGRRDPATGETGPWPWTINAEGAGRFFTTKEEAIAELRQLRASGMRLIDVGCMQINLHHHPQAFASPEEAFDPLANARYAARFLSELKAASGDWMVAAGHYHSHTPARAESYRAQVALRWPEEQRKAGTVPAWGPAGQADGLAPPRSALASSPGTSIRAAPPPSLIRMPGAAPEGMRGRGLDSYRATAIPLATGSTPLLARPNGGRG